jgi:hypothetical protein
MLYSIIEIFLQHRNFSKNGGIKMLGKEFQIKINLKHPEEMLSKDKEYVLDE